MFNTVYDYIDKCNRFEKALNDIMEHEEDMITKLYDVLSTTAKEEFDTKCGRRKKSYTYRIAAKALKRTK